eukprot:CAMPEP_0202816580 /NCGR_PEP_ID=MMETSP1389-20130828/7032_1 /ASSEMBLY_ACC=CAM_ASM_000865 /TAXON_ID=302021 /ORGANISM="Rhodomonas sp., Strain CCMP768" /LENGTH=378 /DNA_ID=CAMNT_0049488647 /DNA_START=26 /DNA_END=1162 /DNA_ORIENTATION=+
MVLRHVFLLVLATAVLDGVMCFSAGGLQPFTGIRQERSLAAMQPRMPSLHLVNSGTGAQATALCVAFTGSLSSLAPSTCLDGGSGGGKTILRSGGGGGDGDEEDDDEAEVAALLKKYNLQMSDLPEGALALPAAKLARFIEAYSNAFNRFLINSWGAWRDKMLADPEFAYKMMVEETVGLGLAMSGTVAARGKDLLNELDFFLTDCAVGAVLNFVLIWLLAPTVRQSAATGAIAQQLSRLPAFVFAEGQYSLAQRAAAGLYKGSLFGACGFVGSVGGTSLAYLLFLIRQMADPEAGSSEKRLPNVLANSLGWASFMFVSTNPRYQFVNGIEQVMYKVVPPSVGRVGSLVLRTGNNVVGGATWVMWARYIGLQKKAEAA